MAGKASRSLRMCCVSCLSRFLQGWLCVCSMLSFTLVFGEEYGMRDALPMLWPRHRFRLGWDNGSWSGQRSLQFAWGLDAHSSLVQAGQFLRLGSRAHPLYIILAFSKVGSCCTNFWRLLGDQRGFAWMNIPDWEYKSSEMTSEDYRFWEWRKTLIVSVCGIFPLFWLLLIVILLEHDVGRHLSDSRADRWERESEDK